MAGDEYSIAGMAIWPWYGSLVQGTQYNAGEFLQGREYVHVARWTRAIAERPAVKRGRMVTAPWAIRPSSCTSAMMQATSIRRRKTN